MGYVVDKKQADWTSNGLAFRPKSKGGKVNNFQCEFQQWIHFG